MSEKTAVKAREKWVDDVKVIACILVVLGHFFQSMTKANILPDSNLYKWFNTTIYYFHVPLFFICSGYLYQKYSRVNDLISWKKNVAKKALALGVPYVTFTTATWVLKTVFSGSVNDKVGHLGDTLLLHPRLYCLSASVYLFVMKNCVNGLKNVRNFARELKTIARDCKCVGLKKSMCLAKFRKQRRTAFVDLNALMPEMDTRISSIIKKLELKPEQESVEYNIFVFWWDGFEKAPDNVKKCLKSVENNYSDFNIIQISKDNYRNYTDIDPIVLEGFENGKISVQTFSDILRFNLLKNNGGMWVDASQNQPNE